MCYVSMVEQGTRDEREEMVTGMETGAGAGTRTSTGMSSRSGMGAKAGAGMLECGSIVRGRKIKMVDSRPFFVLTSERHTAKAS